MAQQQGFDREFWQFSDQLRLQSANFSSLSIGESIWSLEGSAGRRNVDAASDLIPQHLNGGANDAIVSGSKGKLAFGTTTTHNASRYNFPADYTGSNSSKEALATRPYQKNNNDSVIKPANYYNGGFGTDVKNYFSAKSNGPNNNNNNNNNWHGGHGGKKGMSDHGAAKKKNLNNNNNNGNNNAGVDKRFKSLPATEALPRNETIGGYIFVCNNDTMEENLKRELFGLPSRYRDSVRAIRPGLPLFLYNYSTHQLHGIFEAVSFGGTNIDPLAWEDKKCPGESRFPAQVRVATRKICDPLEEDAFRPILHHYDGPKFRLELSVPETIALLDIFAAEA